MGLCNDGKRKRKRGRKVYYGPGRTIDNRLREKGDYGPLTNPRIHPMTLPSPYFAFIPVESGTKYHFIYDTKNNIGNWWNPCVHMRFNGILNPIPSIVDGNGTVLLNLVNEKVDWRQMIFENLPTPPGILLDELAAKTEEHCLTAISPEGSIVNFIIELLQALEGSIKALKSLKELLAKALARFKKMLEELLKRGALDPLAAWWVAWNFCIKPTLSDVRSLLCVAKHALQRLLWLQSRNLKPTQVAMREQKCWEPDTGFDVDFTFACYSGVGVGDPPRPPFSGQFLASGKLTFHKELYELDYVGTGLVIFDIPPELLENPGQNWKAMAVLQGLYRPWEIAWEAIPYSWLLDWCLSYREKLNRARQGDLSPFPDARSLGWGHSWQLRAIYRVTWQQTNDPFSNFPEVELGQCMVRSYMRLPGLPVGDPTSFVNPLSGYHTSILGSIGYLKRRKWPHA
jgi:hypothetical protein